MAVNQSGDRDTAVMHTAPIVRTITSTVPAVTPSGRPTDGQMYPRGDGVPQ